jgi:hypothetical protein
MAVEDSETPSTSQRVVVMYILSSVRLQERTHRPFVWRGREYGVGAFEP